MSNFPSRRTYVALLLTAFCAVIGIALRQAGLEPEPARLKATASSAEPASAGPGARGDSRPQSAMRVGEPAKQEGSSAEDRRQALLDAAQRVDDQEAERLFASAIRDADVSVRREALELSAAAGVPAVDKLVLEVALQDPNPELRDRAFHRANELPVRVRVDVFSGALILLY